MTDNARLTVQATHATHPLLPKYDFYYSTGGTPVQVNFGGFSFFSETTGVREGNPGIDLRASTDGAPTAVDGRYALTFDAYLDQLKAARINFVRTWLFDAFATRVSPVVNNGTYLDANPAYLNRLTEFVSKAKARGIVVCVTLMANQHLRPAYGWATSPWNKANNGPIDATDGRNAFATLSAVPEGAFRPAWTVPQKLYWMQRNLYRQVVNATKPHWNVMYELYNEPLASTTGITSWHTTVAGWLDALLWDAATSRRTRLVGISPGDDLSPTLRAALMPSGGKSLLDVVFLHGAQWGGPAGSPSDLCAATPVYPGIDAIVAGLKATISAFASVPVGLVYDFDAHYYAQRAPKNYVQEALNVQGSIDYRWSGEYLDKLVDPTAGCAKVSPLTNGLPQRLGLLKVALNWTQVTVF